MVVAPSYCCPRARAAHGARLDGAFAAMRCSRHAPVSIVGSGVVRHNILARALTRRQHVGMSSGRSRLGGGGMVVARRRRFGEPAIFPVNFEPFRFKKGHSNTCITFVVI